MVTKLGINHIFLVTTIGAIAPIVVANPAAIAQQNITIIPQQVVEPSLWWKADRLGAGWVENIAINPEIKQAIVTVNINRWAASDYLTRFSFLFKLGTEAQKQNFNVLLHNRRDQKIAEYSTQEQYWRIAPSSLGAAPFRVIAPTIYERQF